MDAKLGHVEYRAIMLKVQKYIDASEKADRRIEAAPIVDMVVNSITVKLNA